MGPVAERPPRAPTAPDPLWAHLLKRTTGREVWEWANHPADELMRRGEGTPPRSVTSPRPPAKLPGHGSDMPSCQRVHKFTVSIDSWLHRSRGGPRL